MANLWAQVLRRLPKLSAVLKLRESCYRIRFSLRQTFVPVVYSSSLTGKQQEAARYNSFGFRMRYIQIVQ